MKGFMYILECADVAIIPEAQMIWKGVLSSIRMGKVQITPKRDYLNTMVY